MEMGKKKKGPRTPKKLQLKCNYYAFISLNPKIAGNEDAYFSRALIEHSAWTY